jgi:hypothetical protein
MAYHKQTEEDRHRKEIQEHATKVVVRRQQYSLIPLVNPDPTLTPDPNPLSDKDINIEDADNDIGALDFPSDIEDIREIEIRGPSGIGDYLATSSSDKLSDPPIT